MSISIQFLGAAGCVTGSQFLVTAGERRVLVDCGMFQGSPNEAVRNRVPLGTDASTLDAILITHAHLDHCGLLPRFWAQGYRGPIFATHATRDLCELMLRDSGYIPHLTRYNSFVMAVSDEASLSKLMDHAAYEQQCAAGG